MKNPARQKLVELIERHGQTLIDDARRCEGLMRDNFPAQRREISVLTSALEERIPAELLAAKSGSMPRSVLLTRLARRLHDDVAMEMQAAHWTVRTWALVLGVISNDELVKLEQADEQKANQSTSNPQVQPTSTAQSSTSPTAQTSSNAPASSTGNARATTQARTSFVVAPDGSGDFTSINDGVRHAPEGARLLVRPGIYTEGFVLDKRLEIVGDGALDKIIVRAASSSVVTSHADAGTIRNLTLRGQARAGGKNGDGFFAVDITRGRLLIEACDISSDSLACVAIHNPNAAPVIRACRIHHGVDSGIYAFDGAGGSIEACDIFENANINIAISAGARTNVTGCHIHHGLDAGIVVWDKASCEVADCEIYANAKTDVGISDEAACVLRACQIYEGANTGVFVHRAGKALIEKCDIYSHAESEVAIASRADVHLRESRITESNLHGVFVADAGRVLIENCDVHNNRLSGAHVDAGGLLVAHESNFNRNAHVGISCEAGGAVNVEGCDLTANRVAAWQTDYGSRVESRNNRL
ncbi:MAG: right-handed parallel beta-helix repeat-containing protein [Pyrinomonadaceae bacterium MAG19_C2-C3]|nr:right-handed parallel beta-helix repeat-containing protein [Pyrinomonadaceae bacterium MAG19_C2-C3]